MAGNIEDTPLWLDVREVMNGTEPLPSWIYRAKIHTEVEDIHIVKVISMDTVRDYAGANTDYIMITVVMPLGDYALKLFPHRDNLQLSIQKEDSRNAGVKSYAPEGEEVNIRKFKAVFMTDNPSIEPDLVKEHIHTLNNSQVLNVKFQLMDIAAAPLLISTVSGNRAESNPENAIRSVLTKGTANIEIDGKPCIDSIDIYKADNTEVRKNIVIKDGMHLVDYPRYIQENVCGVYASGLGTYFQWYEDALRWYVYPLFQPKRFEEETRKRLIIYDVPKEKYMSLNRTYKTDGDVISILITSGRKYVDNIKNNEVNEGAGFRMLDARPIMRKPVDIQPDGTIRGSRTQTNHEVQFEERKDGLNYAKTLPPSGNPFNVYSRVIFGRKAELLAQWQNANADIIYPGMPCKYIYYDGEEVVEVYGNVGATDESIVSATKDVSESPYSVTINLRLFVERIEKLRSTMPDTETFGAF